MKTLRVLGLLLSYPQPEWLAHLSEFRTVVADERLLPARHRKAVCAFIDEYSLEETLALQERYVSTFDRGRGHCLHLFEHIHGESRDRGQAMVSLVEAYADKGLVIDQAELPDYLPLFLEFLSCCPSSEAVKLLGEPVDVIAAIGARLAAKGSPYAVLFDALVALSQVKPKPGRVSEMLAATPDEGSLEALDKDWEEAAAFDGPPDLAGCQGCTVPTPDGLQVKTTQ